MERTLEPPGKKLDVLKLFEQMAQCLPLLMWMSVVLETLGKTGISPEPLGQINKFLEFLVKIRKLPESNGKVDKLLVPSDNFSDNILESL